jgi:membrane associated rhomboid family serine protease
LGKQADVVTLVALAVFGFVAYRMTEPDQRKRGLDVLAKWLRRTVLLLRETPASAPFRQALRERTRWTLAMPALLAINVLLFVSMVRAPGSIAAPETLIEWGASFGPRTTNGEWWRFVTASFVHTGFFAFGANLIGLVQAARLLERLVGPLVLFVVYLAAGTFATVVSLPADPMGITAGGSGAICGVYGLLLATWIRSSFPRSALSIPFDAIKPLAPAAAVFVVFNVFADDVPLRGEAFGLFVGVAAGTALVRRVSEHKPPARRVAATLATVAVIALVAAVPLRGIVDVRPELRALLAIEDKTTAIYVAAVDRLRKGQATDAVLVAAIEQQILPELNAARASLRARGRVPREHRPLIAAAKEYLRLREESWHLRLDGLTGAGMAKLREAEIKERSALELFGRLRSA